MRVLSIFKSVKLAVALILILAGSSVVGTLFPQELPPRIGVQMYGEGPYRLLSFLGVFDLYHSRWFVCLVLLLALNILVCSVSRVRRTYRLTVWKNRRDSGWPPAGLPLRRTVQVPLAPDALWEALPGRLRRLGFGWTRGGPDEVRLDRGRAGRWGPEITHVGFLVIIAGMVVGSLTGFRGSMDLAEGETGDTVTLRSGRTVTLPFSVRCDEFEATFFEDSARPKEYTSWLAVIEDGVERVAESIEVNHPLKYGGYWFYQSTYGRVAPEPGDEWIDLSIHPEDVRVTLGLGERRAIPGTEDEIELVRFEPDFVMEEGGEVTSRSDEVRNVAVQVRLFHAGEPVYEQWVFAQFPEFHPRDRVRHRLEVAGYGFREFTGLQVAFDPGVPVVWSGCGLLVVGIFLSFMVRHRRLAIRVEADRDGSRMMLAAGARGGLGRFGESIDELLRGLGGPSGSGTGAAT